MCSLRESEEGRLHYNTCLPGRETAAWRDKCTRMRGEGKRHTLGVWMLSVKVGLYSTDGAELFLSAVDLSLSFVRTLISLLLFVDFHRTAGERAELF